MLCTTCFPDLTSYKKQAYSLIFNQNSKTMKTLKRLFLLIAATGLLFSCSKYDQKDFDMSGFSGEDHKGHPLMHEGFFIVKPNGVDDTETLREAFADALNYGPGAVVQLVAGEYHLNFIEIHEFNGKFQGAGKGKTIITTIDDLDVDALISENLNTVLIRFVGGDVHMGDMTIKTPPGALSTGSESRIDGLVGFSAYTYQTYENRSGNEYINALINNVDFTGHWDNCGYGLKAEFGCRSGVKVSGGYPLSNTNITITNCLFKDFLYSGALIWHIKDGKINVGTKNNGNVFNNIKAAHTGSSVGYGSLGIWMNVNVEISIVDNTFQLDYDRNFGIDLWRAPYPAFLEQVPQTKATICNIEKNVFNITGGAGGIKMNDRRRYFAPTEAPMLVQVKNNLFNMSNGAYSGIECVCMSGSVIRNNRFTGSGSYGVWIYTDGFINEVNFNENGLMLGNNFSNTTYSIATVLLNERSRNWKIVGANLGENIIDNGENNIIISMNINHCKAPFGPSDVDNFEEIKDAVHGLKGH